MGGFNFADKYKAAGLSPSPEIISLRQEPFDSLIEGMNTEIAIDLTRIYFGLPVPQGTDWFRDAFAETDPSFSMLDNEQEAAVLSACLLSKLITENNEAAAISILTTSAGGNRKPLVYPELIENARTALISIAIDNRSYQPESAIQFKVIKTDIKDVIAPLLTGQAAWPEVANILNSVNDGSYKTTRNLARQVLDLLYPLTKQVAELQEEVSILWWHIGGWSRVLNKPFNALEPGVAAAMAGLDLADLSITLAGPAAAPAILQRTITAVCTEDTMKASVKEVVDAFPSESLEILNLGDELKSVSDICPILTGFHKAFEIGGSPAWEKAYQKATKFDECIQFDLLDLAAQIYRERSLLKVIG